MIIMIKMKRKKGKNSGTLKKSQKVLAALVNTYLQIDRQCNIHLINPPADSGKHFTYTTQYPKKITTILPAIT